MIHCQCIDAIMAFLPSRGHLCHPAQKRGRLTTVVKVSAFTQTKMTDVILSLHFEQGLWWRVLRILSEALQGFSRYLLISGIVSIFFLHWVNHLNLCSLSPVTADCGWCKLPNCYDTCHIAFGTKGCIHYIPALSQSKRTFTNVSL